MKITILIFTFLAFGFSSNAFYLNSKIVSKNDSTIQNIKTENLNLKHVSDNGIDNYAVGSFVLFVIGSILLIAADSTFQNNPNNAGEGFLEAFIALLLFLSSVVVGAISYNRFLKFKKLKGRLLILPAKLFAAFASFMILLGIVNINQK
jgi:Mn2+/Fe2+ NRAMP family transporter